MSVPLHKVLEHIRHGDSVSLNLFQGGIANYKVTRTVSVDRLAQHITEKIQNGYTGKITITPTEENVFLVTTVRTVKDE